MPKTLDGQLTMEKTPSYFVTNEAPKRIHSMAKDIKLIVVVRNPVTRAISDYTQTLSKKPEIPTFEVLAFKNRTLGLIDASWSAIRIGIYALHLENWLQYFPLSQILFVSGERLIVDPAGEMAKVQDFLGLKRVVTEKHFYFNKTKGFPCLKKPEDSSAPRCLGKSKGRTHPRIDPDVIHRLRKFYKPFNMMFYQMTGQDFQWEQEEGDKWGSQCGGKAGELLGRLLTQVLNPPGSAASALLGCQVDLLLCPVRIASNAVGLGREMDPLAWA